MLDTKFLIQNINFIEKKIISRGEKLEFNELITLDQKRKYILHQLEKLRNQHNNFSKSLTFYKKKEKEDKIFCQEDIEKIRKMAKISNSIKKFKEIIKDIEKNIKNIVLKIPNIPHESVLYGKNTKDNYTIRIWGQKPYIDFTPKSHWEIGEKLGILDFVRGVKITGSRFNLYKGQGALLERALINFMLDIHTKIYGYTEVLTPFLVNTNSLIGTGQLPKFKKDLFKIEDSDYYLIPTAEVPITNIHRNEILNENILPIYYVSCSPCFRSEAGSYGQDTKGLIRQHQFNKVELVKLSKPEDSYKELESLTLNAENILQMLGLHYRTVCLCTGELGFSAAKTYDIEVWLPSQETYKEISSCTNFEAFQARRSNIRFKCNNGKINFVHTLNGSGLAIGRTIASIIENYQQKDGTVLIPKILRSYMNGINKLVFKK